MFCHCYDVTFLKQAFCSAESDFLIETMNDSLMFLYVCAVILLRDSFTKRPGKHTKTVGAFLVPSRCLAVVYSRLLPSVGD